MKFYNEFFRKFTLFWSISTIVLFMFGCEQYDYNSPTPGLMEIRFRTKSSNIEFNERNNFVLTVTSVEAVRSDGVRAIIYEDAKATGRTPAAYNIIQPAARDSDLVIGQGFLPPGDYAGVNILLEPGSNVILDGYRSIPVARPDGFNPLLGFRTPFKILEHETTYVNLTIDLDLTLIKGAANYYFYPYYYISSIETYRGASISGLVFDDIDGNSMRDDGEPGIPNWKVFVFGGKNDSTYSNGSGYYGFSKLKPKNYIIVQSENAGWLQTLPANSGYAIKLSSGQNLSGKDFGNFQYSGN